MAEQRITFALVQWADFSETATKMKLTATGGLLAHSVAKQFGLDEDSLFIIPLGGPNVAQYANDNGEFVVSCTYITRLLQIQRSNAQACIK